VWLWTMRRGFAWFTHQAALVAPIFTLEFVLIHPTYRLNVATFFVLFVLGGGLGLMSSIPYAAKYRHWRSILWAPTWFAYVYLRKLATLEAAISLPTRPLLAPVTARAPREARSDGGLLKSKPTLDTS
jgi:hypothetical protein